MICYENDLRHFPSVKYIFSLSFKVVFLFLCFTYIIFQDFSLFAVNSFFAKNRYFQFLCYFGWVSNLEVNRPYLILGLYPTSFPYLQLPIEENLTLFEKLAFFVEYGYFFLTLPISVCGKMAFQFWFRVNLKSYFAFSLLLALLERFQG